METTQKYRQIVREEVDKLQPFDSVTYSAKFMRSLIHDADRLAQAEALLRSVQDRLVATHENPTRNVHPLKPEIDAFLSDGE